MKLYDFILTYANALNDSTDLSQWSILNLGRDFKVFIGIDEREPPTEHQTPYVVILPKYKDDGPQQSKYEFVISVLWVTYINQQTENGKIIEQSQVRLGEEFGEEIWKVILESSECIPTGKVVQIDTTSQFPMVKGEIEISIQQNRHLGYP